MKKSYRLSAIILVICLVISLLSSCGQNKKMAVTRTVTDIMGVEIEIPNKVEKVINLNAFGCQMMIGLGLEDYLVGISEDTFETAWLDEICPEARDIPTYTDETSAETLLALAPDIVFSQDPDVAEELRNKGVPCITYAYLTMDDFVFNIKLIGEVLGGTAKEKCNLYIDYLNEKISDVQETLSQVITEKETMHYINANGDKGFYKTAGANSTDDYCAQLAYVDLATASLITFPESKVDAEALLATNPENVIIGGKYQHVIYDELLKAEEWQHISAIENKNVFKIPMGVSVWNRYSLETALLIPWEASVVYPEYYQFDAVNETIDFYKTFMGYELTKEQAEYMLAGLTPSGEKEISSR